MHKIELSTNYLIKMIIDINSISPKYRIKGFMLKQARTYSMESSSIPAQKGFISTLQ